MTRISKNALRLLACLEEHERRGELPPRYRALGLELGVSYGRIGQLCAELRVLGLVDWEQTSRCTLRTKYRFVAIAPMN